MPDFITSTRDAVEQLYGRKLLRTFPRYGEFWGRFIGVKVGKDGSLNPYGLRFPKGFPQSDKRNIKRIYLELVMAHYSLFCDLAGAHYQLEQLTTSLQLDDAKKKHFHHWEAFESCYMHLGNAMNQIYHLWGLVFLLQRTQGVIVTKDKKMRGIRKALRKYLRGKRKGYLVKDLERLENSMSRIYNNIKHFSRMGSLRYDGKFLIPVRIRRNILWGEQLKVKHYKETSAKARQDLETLQILANQLHDFLINDFSNCLANRNIRIRGI